MEIQQQCGEWAGRQLVGWLGSGVAGWLVGSLSSCFGGLLVGCFLGCLAGRMAGWTGVVQLLVWMGYYQGFEWRESLHPCTT